MLIMIEAKFQSNCSKCKKVTEPGCHLLWDKFRKKIYCGDCAVAAGIDLEETRTRRSRVARMGNELNPPKKKRDSEPTKIIVAEALERVRYLESFRPTGLQLDELRSLRFFLSKLRGKHDQVTAYFENREAVAKPARLRLRQPARKSKVDLGVKNIKAHTAGECACGATWKSGDQISKDYLYERVYCTSCGARLRQGLLIPARKQAI